MNRYSPISTALNWAKTEFGRDVTKSELIGVVLLIGSVVVGIMAVGLRSSLLGVIAGALFVIGDVVFLIGGARAN